MVRIAHAVRILESQLLPLDGDLLRRPRSSTVVVSRSTSLRHLCRRARADDDRAIEIEKRRAPGLVPGVLLLRFGEGNCLQVSNIALGKFPGGGGNEWRSYLATLWLYLMYW